MDIESCIQINVNSPVEIFYYQQICVDSELLVTPWGGLLLKNHDLDGNLLEFHNIDEFDLYFKKTRKHLWLFLKLKIFIDNGNIYGFFVCPECPIMAGVEQLKSTQNPESIKEKLCVHSRVSTMKVQDWRRYWTIATSSSQHIFSVVPSDESTQEVFVPMSSNKPFVACTFHQGSVCILYCVTNRQANPFCSVCTGRKCKHYSILTDVGNMRPDDDLDSYRPVHDEEEDMAHSGHYLLNPPPLC